MTQSDLHRLAESRGLVLGSSSPRRRELLASLGIPFKSVTPFVEETRYPGEAPFPYARRLACQKAKEVADKTKPGQVVLGCDTIVVLDDEVLEKPRDEIHAFQILKKLSGRAHVVCSALALVAPGGVNVSGLETTTVFFRKTDDSQLRRYIATGEPMDKAGAYGIQDKGAFLVDRTEGNLDTVIGLPLKLLYQLAGEVFQMLKG